MKKPSRLAKLVLGTIGLSGCGPDKAVLDDMIIFPDKIYLELTENKETERSDDYFLRVQTEEWKKFRYSLVNGEYIRLGNKSVSVENEKISVIYFPE